MPALLIAAMLACGLADEPEAGTSAPALVAQMLASDDPPLSDAADQLEALGPRALPALHEAHPKAGPEGRRAIDGLIARIGQHRLLRPTLVTLDVADRPLADVVADLNKQTGFALRLEPEDDPHWRETKVTIQEPKPIAFWEAVDHLGRKAKVRHEPLTPQQVVLSYHIRLAAREGPPAPAAQAGPYQLLVMKLGRHRQATQAEPGKPASVREEFTVHLMAVAEPGLLIQPNGPIRLEEAVDDRGQDLTPASTANRLVNSSPVQHRPWPLITPSHMPYDLPLALPAQPGRRIARLRGYLPIVAFARFDERIAFRVEGSKGKTFTSGELAITVEDVPASGASDGTFRLTLKGDPNLRSGFFGPPQPRFAAGPRQMTLGPAQATYQAADFLTAFDGHGLNLLAMVNHQFAAGPPDAPLTVTLRVISPRPTIVDRLRYYGVAAMATEIPFEFSDLPIP